MNTVNLIGNLAADPELRTTQSGKDVGNFRIAVNRGKDEADFFDVVVWERQAELCAQYLSKGDKVGIEGRLQQNRWQTDSGENRSKVEVVAHRVHFLKTKRTSGEEPAGVGAASESPYGAGTGDDDIPF